MNKQQVSQVLATLPEEFELSELVEALVPVRDEADRLAYERLAANFSPEEKQQRAEFVAWLEQRLEQARTEKTYTMEEARAYLDGRQAQREADAEKRAATAAEKI